jgi:hypothetical protein
MVGGLKTMLISLTASMVALDAGEYRCPGYTAVPLGSDASRCRLSYMASGSEPGRSVRPQPSRNRVSPEINNSSTRKHWLPGVWPGVCSSCTGTAPTATTSPPSWPTRSVPDAPVDRRIHTTSWRLA